MKKIRIITTVTLSILLTSILLSNVSSAILASDQLEVGAGTTVEGKLLLDTSVAADKLQAYVTMTAKKIFTPTDILDKLIQFEIIIKPVEYYGFGLIENPTDLRLIFLVFYDNRTTIMLAELYTSNGTESIEMTVLDETKFVDIINSDNRKITFANGTTALAGSLEHADPKYILLENFSLISDSYLFWHKFTLFAISPTAVLGDDISYDPNLGLVVGTPAVTTSNDDSYDAIHVEYYDTLLFNTWGEAYEVHAYYEASSGFLIQLYEQLDQGTWKFIPGTINIVSVPFSIESVIIGLVVLGLFAIFYRKKKR